VTAFTPLFLIDKRVPFAIILVMNLATHKSAQMMAMMMQTLSRADFCVENLD